MKGHLVCLIKVGRFHPFLSVKFWESPSTSLPCLEAGIWRIAFIISGSAGWLYRIALDFASIAVPSAVSAFLFGSQWSAFAGCPAYSNKTRCLLAWQVKECLTSKVLLPSLQFLHFPIRLNFPTNFQV